MNPRLRKNLVSLILTLLIIGGAAFLAKKMAANKKSTVSKAPAKKERRKVTTQRFTSDQESNVIAIDGRLQAHDRVSITSKVQGTLQPTGSSLRAGRYYKEGESLFVIDNREASYNLKAQRSNLLTSITQMMPDLKFDYPGSFEKWDRYLKEMDPERPVSVLPEPSTDQEKFFLTGKNIYNQYYAIKSLETQLSYYTITSPFSGIITEVNAFPGALVSPGQSLGTMINTSTYEMVAPIEMSQVKYVKHGQTVTLESQALGKTWTGKVSRIGTLIDQATQNIPLYISVSGAGLKDGMYLQGSIKGAPLSDVTKLPKSSFVSPTGVYVVEDSTIVAKEIISVKRLDEHILVKGISPEDNIVVSSLSGLFEGQKVNY